MSTNRIRISIFGRKYSNIRIYLNIRFNTETEIFSDDDEEDEKEPKEDQENLTVLPVVEESISKVSKSSAL